MFLATIGFNTNAIKIASIDVLNFMRGGTDRKEVTSLSTDAICYDSRVAKSSLLNISLQNVFQLMVRVRTCYAYTALSLQRSQNKINTGQNHSGDQHLQSMS